MAQNDISSLQAVLAEVFTFSSADIAANRKGELSLPQRERISSKHYADCRVAWIIFAIIFGLGLLGFSAEMIRTGNMNANSLLTYVGITTFFGLIVWAFILYYRWQMKRTLREGNVQLVEGNIHLLTERVEKTQVRYFCIGRHRFRIDEYRHFVLLQQSGVAGRDAILYVSAPWRSVLSVELRA